MAQDISRGLRSLDGTGQNKVMLLLRCASLDPEGHVIYVGNSGVRARPYEMRIEISKPDPRCTPVTSEYDLSNELFRIGFLTHGEVLWTTFRFRPEVLEWYRERTPISESEAFERVGRHFYDLSVSDNDRELFDPAPLAEKLGLPERQLRNAVRALEGAEILIDNCTNEPDVGPCYKLTKPKGFGWAVGGFRSNVGAAAHVAVNVALAVDMRPIVDAIRAIDASPERKRFYELSVRKLEEELNEGQPTWETVKDALSTAADVKEVSVPIITALASRADVIANAISQLGIG